MLVDYHGMSQVQVGRGRVEAELDPELSPARELPRELFLDDQLVGAPTDGLNGLPNGRHV
jgi:hypothetical protein